MFNLKNIISLTFVILFILISFNSVVSANMTEKSPTDIGNSILDWLIEWFMVILKLAVVLGAIYYIIGFGDPESKARGIRLIQAIVVALLIFYGLPWLITAISNI